MCIRDRSILVLTYNIVTSIRSGATAGMNPWNAPTLEWSIPSPPHHYNFAVVPTVESLYPLWDEEANVVEPPKLPSHGEPHMPSPSYWPLVMAFAATGIAAGLLIYDAYFWPGIAVMVGFGYLLFRGTYGWVFEPITEEGPGH